jgi:peptidylprolyl isomerase
MVRLRTLDPPIGVRLPASQLPLLLPLPSGREGLDPDPFQLNPSMPTSRPRQNAKEKKVSLADQKVRRAQRKKASRQKTVLILMVLAVIAGFAIWWTSSPSTTNDGPGVSTPSGLRYIDQAVGTGPSPKMGRKVRVHYTGTLSNGEKFDSSVDRGTPFEFVIGVGQVIKGWDEGVASMKVGGRRKLIIPPSLGYGASSAGKIPPNSTLYFDVELLGVD